MTVNKIESNKNKGKIYFDEIKSICHFPNFYIFKNSIIMLPNCKTHKSTYTPPCFTLLCSEKVFHEEELTYNENEGPKYR